MDFVRFLVGPGSCGCDAGLGVGLALVPGASLQQCLIDTRFDIALRLMANCRQFRDDQIPRPLEHPLFAKR